MTDREIVLCALLSPFVVGWVSAVITAIRLERMYHKLKMAVCELYYSAHWTPDRNCGAERLWENVRDAAGFIPGRAPINSKGK